MNTTNSNNKRFIPKYTKGFLNNMLDRAIIKASRWNKYIFFELSRVIDYKRNELYNVKDLEFEIQHSLLNR